MNKNYYIIFATQFLLFYSCKDRLNITKFIQFNDNGIYGAFFNDKYNMYFAGNGKGKLFVLDTGFRILLQKEMTSGPVATCISSADNEYMINTSGDGTLYIWKIKMNSMEIYFKQKIHSSASMTCLFSPLMNYAISTGHDSSVVVLDWKNKKVNRVLKSIHGTVRFAWVSYDDTFLLWGDDKGYFYKTILLNGHTEQKKISCSAINCVVSNLDNSEIIVSLENGCVKVLDFKDLSIKQTFKAHNGASYVAEYYDLKRTKIATSGYDGCLTFWESKNGRYEIVNKVKAHNSPCCTLYYNDACTQLISGGQDGWLKLWDAKNYKLIKSHFLYE